MSRVFAGGRRHAAAPHAPRKLVTGDFDVLETATGEEALVVASVDQPELVLLDLMLPGINGLETLHHLRSFSKVPVVVMTVRDALADNVVALDGVPTITS